MKNVYKFSVGKFASFLGFYLSLVFPSLGIVQKYLGRGGIFLYAASVLAAIFLIYGFLLKRFLPRVTDIKVYFIAALTILALAIVFFTVYPQINSQTPGIGSDRDDDVNIAASELLSLRYPYYQRTYLGNTISRFPGAIFLSIPFVLLGNGAYQNFFWFFVFFVLAVSFLKNAAGALLLFWVILFLSPGVMHEFLTGGDLLANSIYVLFFVFFLVNSVCTAGIQAWKKISAAVLLGIGLSSRLNFILLLPLVFSALAQNSDLRTAGKYTGLTAFVSLAVTLPFYLYDPAGFSPLYWQFSKISRFNDILPFIGVIVLLLAVIISLALSLQHMIEDYRRLLINCAVVLFFPVLGVVVLSSLQEGRPDLILSGYGINFLFFGTLAFWHRLVNNVTSAKQA